MIIVTGASKGVGKFLADTYANNNEAVVGTYLNSSVESKATLYKVNIANYDEVNDFIQSIENQLTNITLINCAGITYNAFTHKSDVDSWHNVINTNLLGTFNVIRAVLPFMRTQKFGRIINFSSVAAIKPTPGVSSYAASKSALWGMVRSIASENAALNVTANNINLGYSTLGMISTVPDAYLNAIIEQIPSKSLCEGVDIMNTVEYIRSTKYLNGASIDLNGGLV